MGLIALAITIYTSKKKYMPPQIKCDISVNNWDYDLIFGGDFGNALGKLLCEYYVYKIISSRDMGSGSTWS